MPFYKITEAESHYRNLEKKNIDDILYEIHIEDLKAVKAVGKVKDQISKLIHKVVKQLETGGRLFYIGAGTSGRLGVLDASECPPTFGTKPDKVIGLIAGGDKALRKSIENAEDDINQAWKDLTEYKINSGDFLIGIAASGTTPYVLGGLKQAYKNNIPTGCITSNKNSPISKISDFPIEVIVGPEYLTGSSRMKAGTAQKLILNSITTSTMIKLGHVKGNKMIDMQLSNDKLKDRAEIIVMDATGSSLLDAKKLLKKYGSIRIAIAKYKKPKS
tara:strand:- start:203 stop:1024 length:822 start_codon:yes stop_codon:yes gene_type:complete